MARVSLADFTPDTATRREAPPPEPAAGVRDLPLTEIATNPLNARTAADEDPEALQQLADTILHRGVLQPIVVCGVDAFLAEHPGQGHALAGAKWVALIGNRRVAAARLAGATTIRGLVDVDTLASIDEVMLIENGARRDLHPLREAEALDRLREREGVGVRDIGSRIGRTHTYVVQRLALLKLIPELRAALEAGTLTVKRARDLGQLGEAEQRAVAAAGPPWTGNRVSTRSRVSLPTGDPAAAAASILEAYSGADLDELVRLLTNPH